MSKIKPKRSYTTGAVPTTSDLEANELAINWVDGKAYTRTASGNIVSVTLGGGGGGSGLSWSSVPASATASGTAGQIAYDTLGNFYICTATNTWVRSLLAAWETDPSSASVSLLLNMEGAGSTFVDYSGSPKTITALYGATQSTSVPRFGSKSLYLSGTTFGSAPYLSVPYSSAFDLSTGDWTVECWAYPTSLSGTLNMFAINNASGQFAQASVIVNDNGSAYVLSQGANGEWLDTTLVSAGTFQSNTWHHVAYVRSGSTFRLYVNGTSVYSFTSSSALNNGSGISTIGTRVGVGSEGAGSSTWQGYIDEFRVTKGVARYSGSTITVPTAAFPISAPVPTITISAQPSNQTASSGAATFSATASVTQGGSLTYQWQRSTNSGSTFADVSGATSSSLVLSSQTSGNNGDQYRVIVSSSGASSVTSSAATLTVAAATPVTYANKYGSFAHSVTGTSTVTATLTGTGYASADTRLWLLVGTTGTLSYTVTASSQAGFDIGRLFVSSSSPASNAALTAVSGEVSGTQTSSGTLSVTAGQHLVLVYTKDSEDSELNDRITATLSIA
jgi:hypothetical protein